MLRCRISKNGRPHRGQRGSLINESKTSTQTLLATIIKAMSTFPPPPKDYVASHKMCGKFLHQRQLSCRHITDLGIQSIDRPLSIKEKIRYGVHIMICSLCRKFMRQIKSLSSLVHSHYSDSPNTTPRPEFLTKLRADLKSMTSDASDHQP